MVFSFIYNFRSKN